MTAPAPQIGQVPVVVSAAPALLGLLVCPSCRGPLLRRETEGAIDCLSCDLRYPIVDGIPVVMVDSAQPLQP